MSTHLLADTAPTPWWRVPVVATVIALVVGVVLLAFSWPAVTADPHDVPVGVVGTDAQVEQVTDAVAEQSDGAVSLTRYDDRDAAVRAIEQRKAYGAVVLGAEQTDPPEVLKATAASPQVATLMDALAQQLQKQIDAQIITNVEAGVAEAQAKMQEQVQAAIQAAVQAALRGQTPTPPAAGDAPAFEIPTVTVTVTDVVPLSDRDPRGAGLTAAIFPLVLGGMLGGIGLTLLVKGAVRRATGVVVYSAVAGLVVAGVLQGIYGALPGDYLLNASGIALSVGAIAATITGFAGLIGPAGVGVGAAFTMLIANPLAGAALPIEFIAAPWGAFGQWLPPGAAATLIRDLAYFPDADASFAWLVLATWTVAGLALTLVDIPARRMRAGETAAEHPLTV